MKYLAILLLIVAVTAPLNSHSAMAVSDPKSYSYYVKQLKEAQAQLEKLEEQVALAEETKKQVTDMAADVTGVYNRAKGIATDLNRVKGIIDEPRRVFSDAKNILEKLEDPQALFEEVDANLDKIFVDISDPDVNPWMVQKKKRNEVQKIFKDSLRNAEIELASMPARMEAIEALTSQIDTTENIKDSQDLTNRLISELIIGQERMITILSQLAQAEVAAQYSGYNEAVADEFRDRSHLEEGGKKQSALRDYLREGTSEEDFSGPAAGLFGM